MDECEALCSRVCILVNGELQCLGSTDMLKHKYAPGVKLMIKLNPETITPESRDVVVQYVREAWPDSSVKYENDVKSHLTLFQNIPTISQIRVPDSSPGRFYPNVKNYSIFHGTFVLKVMNGLICDIFFGCTAWFGSISQKICLLWV